MTKTTHGHIDIKQLSICLGTGKQKFEALHQVSISIQPGEFVCLLGPSGCGKSTLLGAVAGHLSPSHGIIRVDGHKVREPHPQRGLVFQQHTLFPWQKALDNVAFGLKLKGVPLKERQERAKELLNLVGLAGFEDRYPYQLSGGMQQRVEIARVLINHPRVLLMDEPFGALDAQTRMRMQELLLDVWSRICTSVLFVTHDIDEALFLADRILVMSPRPGQIIEEITLDFERPRYADLVTSGKFIELKRHFINLLRTHSTIAPLQRLTPLGDPRTEPVAQAA